MGEPWLHLVRGGRVILEAVIPLDRYLAGGDIEHDIPEPAAIVLVTKRDQRFEVFLQTRGVMADRFVLCVCIPFAVETLHFLGGTIVAAFIKVNRDKGHACFRELVAFGKYGGLAFSSCGLRASFLPPALFSMFIPLPTEYPWNIERAHFVTESLVCLAACAISDRPTLESYRISSTPGSSSGWAGVRTTMPFPSPALLFAIRM